MDCVFQSCVDINLQLNFFFMAGTETYNLPYLRVISLDMCGNNW